MSKFVSPNNSWFFCLAKGPENYLVYWIQNFKYQETLIFLIVMGFFDVCKLILVIGLCALLYKEVFYLLEHCLTAEKKQEVCVNFWAGRMNWTSRWKPTCSKEGALGKRSAMLAYLLVMRLPRLGRLSAQYTLLIQMSSKNFGCNAQIQFDSLEL